MKLTEFFASRNVKRELENLDSAVMNYAVLVASNEFQTYTEFEIQKLRVADAFLRAVGQPTSITCNNPPVVKRVKIQKFGFVYLMKNFRNGLIKIGFSTDPKSREGTLQSQEPEVSLVGKWPASISKEVALHQLFAKKRVRGEWFALDGADISIIEGSFAS